MRLFGLLHHVIVVAKDIVDAVSCRTGYGIGLLLINLAKVMLLAI